MFPLSSSIDTMNPITALLLPFHDRIMLILIIVMTTVGVAMYMTMASSFSARSIYEAQSLETVWTILPAVILLFIAIPSIHLLYLMDDVGPSHMTLKVVGHQWYWTYEYMSFSDDGEPLSFDSYMVPTNDLESGEYRLLEATPRAVLPTMSEIRVVISSADVIHSWAVPALGIKLDAIPGRLNQTPLYIMNPGIYYGQCSEICGANHSFMPITIEAVSPADFLKWLN